MKFDVTVTVTVEADEADDRFDIIEKGRKRIGEGKGHAKEQRRYED